MSHYKHSGAKLCHSRLEKVVWLAAEGRGAPSTQQQHTKGTTQATVLPKRHTEAHTHTHQSYAVSHSNLLQKRSTF